MLNYRKQKIIFLNQVVGPLFRELAQDLATFWPQSTLLTDDSCTKLSYKDTCLYIEPAPRYDRSSYFSRSVTWLKYFFKGLWFVWLQPKDSILFIVSNPPFLGFLGLFFKYIRRQQYVMLVYDIYPDILIALGRLKRGLFSKCWDFINRLVYENANLVITIDNDMVQRLKKKFDVLKTDCQKVICIPTWADIDIIRPINKEQNWFAKKYGLLDKTTILYSGNMGHSHDIETILEAAKKLREENGIHFLFIGEGAKRPLVEKTIEEYQLKNITLLPFQPEEVLPMSITSGDIGVITYEDGTQGCMSPSKAYYYMAAGLPLLVISNCETDLTKLVEEKGCGIWMKKGDTVDMSEIIKKLDENPVLLDRYKKSARKAAVQFYSRKNSKLFVDALKSTGRMC